MKRVRHIYFICGSELELAYDGYDEEHMDVVEAFLSIRRCPHCQAELGDITPLEQEILEAQTTQTIQVNDVTAQVLAYMLFMPIRGKGTD